MGGTLGLIITVYQHLSIQFFWNNQLVRLWGECEAPLIK